MTKVSFEAATSSEELGSVLAADSIVLAKNRGIGSSGHRVIELHLSQEIQPLRMIARIGSLSA